MYHCIKLRKGTNLAFSQHTFHGIMRKLLYVLKHWDSLLSFVFDIFYSSLSLTITFGLSKLGEKSTHLLAIFGIILVYGYLSGIGTFPQKLAIDMG